MKLLRLGLLLATYDVRPQTVHEKIMMSRAWACGRWQQEYDDAGDYGKRHGETFDEYWDRIDALKENLKQNSCAEMAREIGQK